jgi:plastocyanin
MIKTTCFAAATVAAALLLAGCGGSSTGPSSSGGNNNGGGNSGGGSVNTTTITITSAGVSPKDITVAVGSRVTFMNNDSIGHDMNSDPHPEHTSCPAINVGNVLAGQSRTSENLTTARVCTYHDHNQPSNTNLQGTIRIQ